MFFYAFEEINMANQSTAYLERIKNSCSVLPLPLVAACFPACGKLDTFVHDNI